ncbi:MAG: MetS family NSS transporter small subunit [bacterium]|nr:MetS family NSS transporter small subunit [bacterium]
MSDEPKLLESGPPAKWNRRSSFSLAPIGYDEGRAFLENLARQNLSPRLREAVEEGLAAIDRTQHMTLGAWIMFAVGVILLFGGSALAVSIAIRRGKPHIYSADSAGEP